MADFDIFYQDKKVGEMRDGAIHSEDVALNKLLTFIDEYGVLITKSDGDTDKLVYSDDPEDFYEFLMNSGFLLLEK